MNTQLCWIYSNVFLHLQGIRSVLQSLIAYSVVAEVVFLFLLVWGSRSEGKVWNKAAHRPSAHQLCSKVQTCHNISSHLSRFTTGHWGSHTAAAAVLVVGLGDPMSFMLFNLLSSHWGKTLNDPLRRLYDSCSSLTCFSFHMKCHSLFFMLSAGLPLSCRPPHLSFPHKTQSSQQMIH